MKPREDIKFLAGLVLAGALLWWVLRDTDPKLLWSRLGSASLLGIFLCALLNIGHTFFMNVRMTAERLRQTWDRQLQPLIEEYFFDQPDIAAQFTLDRFWKSAQ